MHDLEELVSADRSLMLSAVVVRNIRKDQLTAKSAKLQFVDGALTGAFDQLKEYSSVYVNG